MVGFNLKYKLSVGDIQWYITDFLFDFKNSFSINNMKINKLCLYCAPIANNPWHLGARFEKFVSNLNFLSKPFIRRGSGTGYKGEKFFVCNLIKLLSWLGLAEIATIKNRAEIRNRTLVIVDEARKRGYDIKLVKLLNNPTELFQLNHIYKLVFFYALPLLDFTEKSVIDIDDKYAFNLFLKKNHYTYIPTEIFIKSKEALNYGIKLGFPLVVKPRFGSLSRHTTVNINNETELKEAIRIAKIIANEIVVQKYIQGNNYRVIIVGGKFIACAFREPPSVLGDGFHTVKQLIEFKNSQPYRGDKNQRDCTLHKIEMNWKTDKFLKACGYAQDSILEYNKKIYLDDKIILSCGADISDVTDLVNKTNIKLFEEIASRLETSLVGFDVITKDISRPYYEGPFGINEANSIPYIDMHHFPTYGQSRDVAKAILDEMERRLI